LKIGERVDFDYPVTLEEGDIFAHGPTVLFQRYGFLWRKIRFYVAGVMPDGRGLYLHQDGTWHTSTARSKMEFTGYFDAEAAAIAALENSGMAAS